MTTPQRNDLESAVAAHYRPAGLAEAIEAGLRQSGADPEKPGVEDLAPVDEFHTAGRLATLQALEMIPLAAGMHVLDAGSGIGGTSRCIAAERGCRVTGLDLTPEYVELAQQLTERVGLSDRCGFQQGSVLDMPFADASFDAAVSFHVAMNIDDRARFYRELARVLKPGGQLCVFDIMNGPADGPAYPVPWAETATTSFLRSREETRGLLESAGFAISGERNLREFAVNFYRKAAERQDEGPPPLGLHLLTGANAPEKFANVINGYEQHQIEPVILVAAKE